jgi:hypothetical protein
MALARRKAVSSAAWRLRVNLSLVFGLCLVDRDDMSFSFGLDELAFFRRLFAGNGNLSPLQWLVSTLSM